MWVLLKVRDVRTNDDTLITVKLMVFYELRDIETMVRCVCVCVCVRVRACVHVFLFIFLSNIPGLVYIT